MENKLMIFENEAFGKVRTLNLNGEPWFVAADVCKALELGNPSMTVERLDDDEKGILFNFRNRGYINLWLVLSIIEGPKTYTFDVVLSRNIKCNIMVRDKKLEEKLTEYLRAYYDNNATDVLGKIYAACLKVLGSIIKNSGLSEQNMIAALYEVTASSMDNRKFFWDLIGWEKLELMVI